MCLALPVVLYRDRYLYQTNENQTWQGRVATKQHASLYANNYLNLSAAHMFRIFAKVQSLGDRHLNSILKWSMFVYNLPLASC